MHFFGYPHRIEHGNLRREPRSLHWGSPCFDRWNLFGARPHTQEIPLVFFSLGYANEIPLPNAGYHLYNCRSLTMPLVPQEESRRHSASVLPGRVTRSRARREEFMQQQPQPQPQQYEAGGSSWQSASSTEWAWQASGRRSTSSSSSGPPITARRSVSSRGFATLTQQMGELNVHASNIEESLGQHI